MRTLQLASSYELATKLHKDHAEILKDIDNAMSLIKDSSNMFIKCNKFNMFTPSGIKELRMYHLDRRAILQIIENNPDWEPLL